MAEFFRHCPECGRRFHIKLESKKLVTEHRESVPRLVPRAATARGGNPIILQQGTPIIIDVEEFQYLYKCKHCGHEWSEKRTESRRES